MARETDAPKNHARKLKAAVTRRDFVISATAAAGGLLVACKTRSGASTRDLASNVQSMVAIRFPNAWVAIRPDGKIAFTLDKVEMGQGTMTTLASIVADEVEVDLDQIVVQFAPPDLIYINNGFFVQVTGGSNSISSTWQPLRLAAAATREMLIQGGAQKMRVPANDCKAERGRIIHTSTGNSVGYGEIAAETARNIRPPRVPMPKSQADYTQIMRPNKRLDSPEKVMGAATFGIDVKLDNLLVAVVARVPEHGGKLDTFDDGPAQAYLASVNVQGDILQIASGVAVVTKSYYYSHEAVKLLIPTLKTSGGMNKQFDGILKKLSIAENLTTVPATTAVQRGNAADAYASAAKKLESFYEIPYAPHATLEPQNCTARFDGTTLEIWAPTQAPDGARGAAARASGIREANIKVTQTYIGGAFGRRISQDYVADAAEIAVKLRQAVKVIYSREDDTRHDFYRPGMYNVLRGSVADGRISSWYHRIIGQSIAIGLTENAVMAATPSAIVNNSTIRFLGRVVERIQDKHLFVDMFAVEGADKIPYIVPHMQVEYKYVETGVPIGFWRSVGHSHNAFCVESFVDELAKLAGSDPYEFRLGMLSSNDRAQGTLRAVAALSHWTQAPAAEAGIIRAKGLASHSCFGSYCSQVVQIAIKDGRLRVEKVWATVDVGLALNPDIVRQQVEGAIIYGLTAALKQQITFRDGITIQENFRPGSDLIRMNEAPDIYIELVNAAGQGQDPTGVGELAVPPLAPALANAIAKALGEAQRPRALPITMPLMDRMGQSQGGTNPGGGSPANDQELARKAYSSLDRNCVSGCHEGDSAHQHDDWTTLESLGSRVKPGNPEGSKIIRKIRDQEMPIDANGNFKAITDPDDIKALVDWIKAGAPRGS